MEPLDAGELGGGLPHAVLRFEEVKVASAELEPGDAFTSLVRPFRLYEDLFGAAASEALALAVGRKHSWARGELELACAQILALRALVELDPQAPSTQIAAAGALELAAQARSRREPLWQNLPSALAGRLQPAGAILTVASEARQLRRDRAWERLDG